MEQMKQKITKAIVWIIIVVCVCADPDNCKLSSSYYNFDLSSLDGKTLTTTYAIKNGSNLTVEFTLCGTYNGHNSACDSVDSPICIKNVDGSYASGGDDDYQPSITFGNNKDTRTGSNALQLHYQNGGRCYNDSMAYTGEFYWETIINIYCDTYWTTEYIVSSSEKFCTLTINMISIVACPVRKTWVAPVLVGSVIIGIIISLRVAVLFFQKIHAERLLRARAMHYPYDEEEEEEEEEEIEHNNDNDTTLSSHSLFINDPHFVPKSTKEDDSSPSAIIITTTTSSSSTNIDNNNNNREDKRNIEMNDLLSSSAAEDITEDEKSKILTKQPTQQIQYNESICKICLTAKTDCALVDCGHVVCANCAANLSKCPFCRRKIITRVKLFHS